MNCRMNFRISSADAEGNSRDYLELQHEKKSEKSASLATLESDLTALGFSASEIDELCRDGDNELSRCLEQVLELHVRLHHSIQLQERHTQTVLRADSALSKAEHQLFGKMSCYSFF